LIDRFIIRTGKLFSLLTLLVVFVVVYEILMRYIFHAPTLWASESMVFGCALVYVMGAAWTAHEGKHVKIELVYGRLSARGRAIADAVSFLFFALYLGMMLWASLQYAWDSLEVRETSGSPWNPPIYPFKIALAAGIFLLLLQGVGKLIRDLHVAIRGEHP
jgi:TRAP-type mannitol/chloroaromatic compound transport system permease small subunit